MLLNAGAIHRITGSHKQARRSTSTSFNRRANGRKKVIYNFSTLRKSIPQKGMLFLFIKF